MNTSSASSTHISSNSSGNISNPILDAKHGLSAKDDIAKPERAVTELVHGGSVKHPPRMTEHTKFKAYVGSSDTMVDKSTFLEGGATINHSDLLGGILLFPPIRILNPTFDVVSNGGNLIQEDSLTRTLNPTFDVVSNGNLIKKDLAIVSYSIRWIGE